MHILIYPYFFFTNRISTPYSEWFSLIKLLFNNSCNCFFSFRNSTKATLYGALEIDIIPRASSKLNSTFLSSVNPRRLIRNLKIINPLEYLSHPRLLHLICLLYMPNMLYTLYLAFSWP